MAGQHSTRRRAATSARAGFTLLEGALVLALSGALLAAFVPTFVRHLRTSKLAEASTQLEALQRHAAAYFEASWPSEGGALRHCLPGSVGPFPTSPSTTPVLVDFASDAAGRATWSALGQSTPELLRYSYEVSVTEPGCRERSATSSVLSLRAHGDLDGDGELSLLEREATLSADRQQLVPHGPLRIVARTE